MTEMALLWPRKLSLSSYIIIFKNNTIVSSFVMSVLRTVVGIIFCVFISAMTSFALRRKYLKFRWFYIMLFTIPIFFGGGLVPEYLNLSRLGLIDSFWVYIIPNIFAFFFLVILMASFNGVPDSLEESALIDGAGYFKVFFTIYIPVSIPVLATLSLFAGVAQWNSWFDTIYFTRNKSLMTLSALLMKILTANQIDEYAREMEDLKTIMGINSEGVKLATMIVSVVPILAIYPFLQKYFIKGIMVGSIKG
jgi:putative aldouronate transport system permease protein